MSLYDIAVADGHQHERGQLLRSILGGLDVPRFRDAWVEKDGLGLPVIVIYTRTGGPNRRDYTSGNKLMAGHPCYLRDTDDKFDSTYATWYFRCPPEHRDRLMPMAGPHVDTDARWREAIARIEAGEISPAMVAFGDRLAAHLNDPDAGPVIEV
jgi:hypothetical protein